MQTLAPSAARTRNAPSSVNERMVTSPSTTSEERAVSEIFPPLSRASATPTLGLKEGAKTTMGVAGSPTTPASVRVDLGGSLCGGDGGRGLG